MTPTRAKARTQIRCRPRQLHVIFRGCVRTLPVLPKKQTRTDALQKQLEAGGCERTDVYEHLCRPILVFAPDGEKLPVPRLVALAIESKGGSKLVQRALEVASPTQQTELVNKLKGFVSCLATSKHGNYVIQKLVEILPSSSCSYHCVGLEILTEFTCVVGDKFGCRVVQRLLEHLDNSDYLRLRLIAAILESSSYLCWDDYGHFTVESLLEHGQASEQAYIVQTLLLNADPCHGKGRFVVEKVFELMLLPQALPLLPPLQPGEWNEICRWAVLVVSPRVVAAPNGAKRKI